MVSFLVLPLKVKVELTCWPSFHFWVSGEKAVVGKVVLLGILVSIKLQDLASNDDVGAPVKYLRDTARAIQEVKFKS